MAMFLRRKLLSEVQISLEVIIAGDLHSLLEMGSMPEGKN
jgi:hypothetical protein